MGDRGPGEVSALGPLPRVEPLDALADLCAGSGQEHGAAAGLLQPEGALAASEGGVHCRYGGVGKVCESLRGCTVQHLSEGM